MAWPGGIGRRRGGPDRLLLTLMFLPGQPARRAVARDGLSVRKDTACRQVRLASTGVMGGQLTSMLTASPVPGGLTSGALDVKLS
jgi:hypothetical protein